MKTTLKAFALALLLFTLAACNTAKVDLSSAGAVAIMTVYGNENVPWFEVDSPNTTPDQLDRLAAKDQGILSTFINSYIQRDNPEYTLAQDRINDAAQTFTQALRAAGLTVTDPVTLPTATAYTGAQRTFRNRVDAVYPAEGYRVINGSPKKQSVTMAEESGAQAMLYVNFTFQKQRFKEGRDNIVRARVVMTVKADDASGKTIIDDEYTALSDDFSLYERSDWDVEKICSLFSGMIPSLASEFITEYFPGTQIAPYNENAAAAAVTEEPAGEAVERETIVVPIPGRSGDDADASSPAESQSGE